MRYTGLILNLATLAAIVIGLIFNVMMMREANRAIAAQNATIKLIDMRIRALERRNGETKGKDATVQPDREGL